MPAKRYRAIALLLALLALLASGCNLGKTEGRPSLHAKLCAQDAKTLASMPGAPDLYEALRIWGKSEDVYAVIWVDVHRLQAPDCSGSPEADPQLMMIDKSMLAFAIDKAKAVLSKAIYRPVASEFVALVRFSGPKDTAVESFQQLMKTVDGDLAKTGIGGNGPLSYTSVSGKLFVGEQPCGSWYNRASRVDCR